MRIAIFSDVHGNALALDAVLADIDAVGGVDGVWFVGDAAAFGHDPARAVASLISIPGLVAVRGNTDRYLTSDDPGALPNFAAQLASADDAVRHRADTTVRSLRWTREQLVASGGFDWVAHLPTDARIELPDGARILVAHASPGTDDGPGLRATQSDDEIAALIADADADVIVVGHTHLPMERTVGGVRLWNLGSVSMPFTDDQRAMWTLLDANASGYTLERHFSAFDIDAMLSEAMAAANPALPLMRATWKRG